MKIQKKKNFYGGKGSEGGGGKRKVGFGVRMDVNEELKFL